MDVPVAYSWITSCLSDICVIYGIEVPFPKRILVTMKPYRFIARYYPVLLMLIAASGLFTRAHGRTVDTLITGNGSAGPYILGDFFIDTSSLQISRTDSGYVPSFTYIPSVNGLLFSDPLDSGNIYTVRFQTELEGLLKVYSFYKKRYETCSPEETDTGDVAKITRNVLREDNLTVSGYKSIGVSVGSFGQVNLEQGLDVRIGGEIRPGTRLSAHLNDQGTSLDGATREISEFDRIYVTLSDPRFKIVAGDQYVHWPVQSILSGQKKIKGIAVSLHPGNSVLHTFGALAGGNFTVQTWRTEKGQGPYPLTGNGETGFINPIAGTMNLTINGEQCEEGPHKEYTVDYELGTVTFTPLRLVNPEDIVRAEYEYKLFDYQRTIAGTALHTSLRDSLLTVEGALWTEADNKHNPIDLTLTDANIKALEDAGDHPPADTAAYLVNRNDVLDRYASVPLYTRRDSGGITIFQHQIPDPNNIEKNDSLYEVHFIRTDSCGAYIRTVYNNEFIYRYAGTCNGDYTPQSPLHAPVRRTSGELRARLSHRLLQAEIDIAGQELDRNLFSSRDDNDNLSSALNASAQLGRRSTTDRSLWLTGAVQYFSSRFDREGLSADDRKNAWNDTSLSETGTERTFWEMTAGVTPASLITAHFTYGQQRESSLLLTDKMGGSCTLHPWTWFTTAYRGNYFRHFLAEHQGNGHRQHTSITADFPLHTFMVSARDEWRRTYSTVGNGLLEGSFSYVFHPLQLQQEAKWTSFRKGKGLYRATDTADAFSWMQKVDCHPLRAWHLSGNSSWQLRRTLPEENRSSTTTLLIDVNSETGSFSTPLSTRQHYRTTAERASRYLQVPTYVGEGHGTHVWDSTRQEYTEDPRGNGDFIIRQSEVLDSTNNYRTRKTRLDGSWSFRPPENKFTGILADLSWEGRLSLEEHVDADLERPPSWLPGYLSLRSLSSRSDWQSIRYSTLSYLQEILWKPSFNRRLDAQFSVRPQFSFIRSYREKNISFETQLNHTGVKNSLSGSIRHFNLSHQDTSAVTTVGNYSLNDFSMRSTITHHFSHGIDLFISPVIGWGRQRGTNATPVGGIFDSTLYGQLSPGIEWTLPKRGTLTTRYTFSLVTIPENRDYRVAGGFAGGISHTITFNGHIRAGKYFMLNGSYRGEIFGTGPEQDRPAEHIMSLEVQAYLQ